MANLQIRIDDTLKTQAQTITAELGMDVATAVRIFLAQMVREKALPFTPSLDFSYAAKSGMVSDPYAQEDNAQLSREEWLSKAVHTGLQALKRQEFVSDKQIKEIFAKAGANVD